MAFGSLGNVPEVLAAIIAMIVLWVVASFPLYFSSKFLVHDRSEFGRALLATFVTASIFVLFLVLFAILIPLFSAIIGFILILLVLMAIYSIGVVRAFLLAVLTFIVFLVLSLLLTILGIAIHIILF
jgi:hypothetical protein